jgi:hypothetical protein
MIENYLKERMIFNVKLGIINPKHFCLVKASLISTQKIKLQFFHLKHEDNCKKYFYDLNDTFLLKIEYWFGYLIFPSRALQHYLLIIQSQPNTNVDKVFLIFLKMWSSLRDFTLNVEAAQYGHMRVFSDKFL